MLVFLFFVEIFSILEQSKKKMNESIKKFKKVGDKDDLEVALEDEDDKAKILNKRSASKIVKSFKVLWVRKK